MANEAKQMTPSTAKIYQHIRYSSFFKQKNKVAVNIEDGIKVNLIGLKVQQAAVEKRVVEYNWLIS